MRVTLGCMAFPLRFRRFFTRAALIAHEAQVRAILAGLSEDELTEASLTCDLLRAIIDRHLETRRGLRKAAR